MTDSGIRIETPRLIIREHIPEDADIIETYSTQEPFWRYLQIGELQAGSGTEFIEYVIESRAQAPRLDYHLGTERSADNQLIGSIRLGPIDIDARESALGFGIDPEIWGRGYATEAAAAVISLGFSKLGLHRIFAYCDDENAASCRVLEKLGLRLEGHLRQHRFSLGTWRSSFIYAILEDEWAEKKDASDDGTTPD